MTVAGLGIDLVEIARVDRLIKRYAGRALDRLLTEAEREYCLSQAVPARHVAARLAAKEAAYKALQAGAGARAIGWRESELVRDPNGRPVLHFHGLAATTAAGLGVTTTLVSVSHTDQHAAAVVVLLT